MVARVNRTIQRSMGLESVIREQGIAMVTRVNRKI